MTISADRFIASKARDELAWLDARADRITATVVAKAATRSGFAAALAGSDFTGNEFTQYGNEAEPAILDHAHREFGILPSDWLITSEGRDMWAATPDGLSPDHREIAEAKTTGTDWRTIPAQYRRQVQWQLHVTGADRCLFLWVLRLPDDLGWFYTPWLEPKTEWIDRDESVIAELVEVAEALEDAGYGRA